MTVELILGGTRSGKSAHAEQLLDTSSPARYVATARRLPDDPEFDARIARHTARRPDHWHTIESIDLTQILIADAATPILIDDLATWLTALLDDANVWQTRELGPVHAEIDRSVQALIASPARVVIVSAEVGLGVVPASASGRLFRDELGALNARVAEVSDSVTLMVAGVAMRLR